MSQLPRCLCTTFFNMIEFSNKWRIQWSLWSFLIPEEPNSAFLKKHWLTQNWSQMCVLEKSQPDLSERAMAKLKGPLWGFPNRPYPSQLTFCVLSLLYKAYPNLKLKTITSYLSFPWVRNLAAAGPGQSGSSGSGPHGSVCIHPLQCVFYTLHTYFQQSLSWLDI